MTEITTRSRLIVKADAPSISLPAELLSIRNKKVWGVPAGAVCPQGRNSKDWYIPISFFSKEHQRTYSIQQCFVEAIPESEYEKYDQNNVEYVKNYFRTNAHYLEMMTTPAKGTYLDIDTNKTHPYLYTCYVYAHLCKIDFKTGEMSGMRPEAAAFPADCCDCFKQFNDLVYYFPVGFLNYYGYTQYDLFKWLQFVSNFDIGFEYILEGECEFPEVFKEKAKQRVNTADKQASEYYVNGLTAEVGYKAKFVEIKIKGGVDSWILHMHLMCIRYMHYYDKWFIPALAMQIKEVLGDKITNWQAFMMAHFHEDYGTQRGFIDHAKFHDMFIEPKTAYQNIKSKHKMWESFNYITTRTNDLPKCAEMIKNKQYAELLEFCKSKK